eukprot:1122204-Alexandrium_andersonii.AAC.1
MAEMVMNDARKLCAAANVPEPFRAKLLGELDVRLILHMLRRGREHLERKTFSNFGEIVEAFILAYMRACSTIARALR